MSIRHNQIRFALLIGLFVALVATAGTPTPPPPKEAALTCEIAREVKLGERGIISCTGFTPNGEVKVIFYRPDGTTSEHLGKADGDGNFDGTFTVAPDRPPGQWTLNLTDISSGRKIAMPFTVLPSLEETPIPPTTTVTTTLTTPTPPLIPTAVATTIVSPLVPTPTPAPTVAKVIWDLLLVRLLPYKDEINPWSAAVCLFAAIAALLAWLGFDWLLRSRVERRKEPPVIEGPEGPGAGFPRQGPCGFSSKEEKKVFGDWRFAGSMAGKITEPEEPPHTHVIWERDVVLERTVIGPCPLVIDHPGDHQERLGTSILLGTEKLTVHYDAFITGSDAKELVPSADGQPPANPEPVDAELQFTPAGE